MLIKIAAAYLMAGIIFSIIYVAIKSETRAHVVLAVITGWPIFLFSMIGAGWNALLNQEKHE